jgi:hypothetical protein
MGKPEDGIHEDGPPIPPTMMHWGMAMMSEIYAGPPVLMRVMGLGLDEKQREEIMEIEKGLMKNTVKMKSEIQIAMIEMKDILDKYPADMKAVESKRKKWSRWSLP